MTNSHVQTPADLNVKHHLTLNPKPKGKHHLAMTYIGNLDRQRHALLSKRSGEGAWMHTAVDSEEARHELIFSQPKTCLQHAYLIYIYIYGYIYIYIYMVIYIHIYIYIYIYMCVYINIYSCIYLFICYLINYSLLICLFILNYSCMLKS